MLGPSDFLDDAMRALLLFPVLALGLLGAHFYRASAWPLVLACIAVVVLLAWQRPWVARVAQAALLIGAAEWVWTTHLLVQQRLALGLPWLRLALILGAVAAFTALSALVFRSAALRSRYAGR